MFQRISDKDQESPDSNQTSTSPPVMPGDEYVIPPEGSLGLLALGAVGLREWRYAREEAKRQAEQAESVDPDPAETDSAETDSEETGDE